MTRVSMIAEMYSSEIDDYPDSTRHSKRVRRRQQHKDSIMMPIITPLQAYHDDEMTKFLSDTVSISSPFEQSRCSSSKSTRTEVPKYLSSTSSLWGGDSISHSTSKTKSYSNEDSISRWYRAGMAQRAKDRDGSLTSHTFMMEPTKATKADTADTPKSEKDEDHSKNSSNSDSSTTDDSYSFGPQNNNSDDTSSQDDHQSNISGLLQIEALQNEIQTLKDESSRYHEMLEFLENIKSRNAKLEREIAQLNQKSSQALTQKDKYKRQLTSLQTEMEGHENKLYQQDQLHNQNLKKLQSVIIQDQRYFALKIIEHKESVRRLKYEKEKTKTLEAIYDDVKTQLTEYETRNKNMLSTFIIRTESERQEILKLEQQIAHLKVEIAKVQSRDDWHTLQIKKYEHDFATSGDKKGWWKTSAKDLSQKNDKNQSSIKTFMYNENKHE